MRNLKKILPLLILVFLFHTQLTIFASESILLNTIASTYLSGKIIINGNIIQAATPYIKADTNIVMVPLRVILKSLKIEAIWNSVNQSIDVGTTLHIFIGKNYYILGSDVPIESEFFPELHDNIAFVPLQFFQDILLGYVSYIQDGDIVIETVADLPVIELIENPYIYNPLLDRVVTTFYNSSLGFSSKTFGIEGQIISPSNGLNLSNAEDLIMDNLMQNSILEGCTVREITVNQTWKVNKTQLFLIEPVKWLAIFQDNKFIKIYKNSYMDAVYLADIDDDGKYELVINEIVGSGSIYLCIKVFDLENLKEYKLDRFDSEDLLLSTNTTGKYLDIYQGRFCQAPRPIVNLAGHLVLKNNRLIVENSACPSPIKSSRDP